VGGGDGRTDSYVLFLLGPRDPQDDSQGSLSTSLLASNETNFVSSLLLGGQPENRNLWDFKVFLSFQMGRITLEEREQQSDESELHSRTSARAP
jgi:hypothetical protein